MYANLKGENLEKLQSLEKEMGVYLLATPRFKVLSHDEMKDLTDLEKKLGAVLIAYDA